MSLPIPTVNTMASYGGSAYQSAFDHAMSQYNNANQPKAAFWSSWEGGRAEDNEMYLPPGKYEWYPEGSNFSQYFNGGTDPTHGNIISVNNIDSIWVPPNYLVRAVDHDKPEGALLTGKDSNVGVPGMYWNLDRGTYPGKDQIGINKIDRLEVILKDDIHELTGKFVPLTWARHKQKCCLGVSDNISGCGKWAPSPRVKGSPPFSSHCEAAFGECTADDLKNSTTTATNDYKARFCRAKYDYSGSVEGDAVPYSSFDAIKSNYCADHPEDSWCDCMLLEKNPKYIKWVELMKQLHPNVPPVPLAYRDGGRNPCTDNNDLAGMFISSAYTRAKSTPVTSYNIQDLIVSGSNNIVTGNRMDQTQNIDIVTNNQTKSNQNLSEAKKDTTVEKKTESSLSEKKKETSPEPEAPSIFSSAWFWIAIVILFLILVVIISSSMGNKKKSTLKKDSDSDTDLDLDN